MACTTMWRAAMACSSAALPVARRALPSAGWPACAALQKHQQHHQARHASTDSDAGTPMRKPVGLSKAEDISTLEEWNEKKAEMKAYRTERRNMSVKKKQGRPKRPRIRLTNRETWLGGRSFEMKKAEEAREASGLDWEYHAAVLLERLPVVVPEPEDWEVAWMDFMSEFRWNCGRQYPAELDIWREDRDAPAPSFREQHEACPIPLAPRVTEADASGDRTTLHRALDRRIFLLERASDAEPWRFVTAAVQRGGSGGGDGGGGETLRAAAERALAAALRPDVPGFKYWHVGNGPAGVDWRIFGEEERAARGAFGEKVFLMRAQIVVGEPAFARRGVQRVWVAKEELAEYFGAERGQYYVKLL